MVRLKPAFPRRYDERAMNGAGRDDSTRDGRARIWWPLLVYVVLTIVLAYPLSIDPAGRLLSASADMLLMIWMLMWDTYAFIHRPFSIFEANIYYPQHDTLAYSENLIGSAVFAAPILWLTKNPVLAINIVALLSCVLCGVGAWLLARRLGVSQAGATLAGLIFAFCPPRFLRLGQIHLTTIQWIPFALAYLHAYLDEKWKSYLLLAVAFLTLQALTSGHGAVYLIVAMTGLVVFRAASGDPIDLARRARDFGVAGVLLIAPALLIVLPYRRVQVEMGLRRQLVDWPSPFSSLLASPAHLHTRVLSLFPDARINETASAYLFPGYVPLALAAAAVLLLRGRKAPAAAGAAPNAVRRWLDAHRGDATLFYALLTVLSVLLSLGTSGGVWPLVYWLPGMNFIRIPSRFMLLGILSIAVLAGIGFDRLTARLAPKKALGVAALLGALMVAEFAAMPLGTIVYPIEIPAIDRWLDTQPKPFAIAEVPFANPRNVGAYERRETNYMLHATAHWQKTIHGYSGLRPPLHFELYSQLEKFPDQASVDALARLGVRYVVVHTDYYTPSDWAAVEQRIEDFPQLKLEHVEGAGRVYSIAPP
jgi:hypothetical protein